MTCSSEGSLWVCSTALEYVSRFSFVLPSEDSLAASAMPKSPRNLALRDGKGYMAGTIALIEKRCTAGLAALFPTTLPA